jgi:putative transposase
VQQLRETFQVSERHACELVGIAVSTFRYQSERSDAELCDKLVTLAREKPRFGYRRLHVLVRRDGLKVNHKRVWRVYRDAGLCVKRRKRKRLVRTGVPAVAVTAANQQWALDFASDAIATGRAIRILSVIDVFTRECLALEVDTSFASRRVTRVLDRVIGSRGQPQSLRCDNGPELTSRHFLAWCVERKINLVHIQPGRPMQNGHVESFTGKLRDECLNTSWFRNLFDARRKIAAWQREYNSDRPHSSLGYVSPAVFAARAASPSSSLVTAPGALSQGNPSGSLREALTQAPLRGSDPTTRAKRHTESAIQDGVA